MNNQFSGPNVWDHYLTALERATPVIEAISVTDYYVTDTYKAVLRQKAAGGLPATKLVFPSVELRLDVATAKGGFVNLHRAPLLGQLCRTVSPRPFCRLYPELHHAGGLSDSHAGGRLLRVGDSRRTLDDPKRAGIGIHR